MYPVNFKINIVHSIICTEIFFNLLLLKIFTTTYFLNFIRNMVTSCNFALKLKNRKRAQANFLKSIIARKIFTILSTDQTSLRPQENIIKRVMFSW